MLDEVEKKAKSHGFEKSTQARRAHRSFRRQRLRSEAYLSYAATTKDEAQRSIRTFYEAVML